MCPPSQSQCVRCGIDFDPSLAVGIACPSCGATARTLHVGIEERLDIHDHLSVLTADTTGAHKGFSESERLDGVATSATIDALDLTQSAQGPGSFNESGGRDACLRLIAFLNTHGGTWLSPEVGQADVDWTSVSSNRAGRLQMQVVRTPIVERYWRELSIRGAVSTTSDLAGSAEMLWLSIEKKLTIPAPQRGAITLVLDANRAPGLALSPMVDEFRRVYGVRARGAGFNNIFVVGPTEQLVSSLHS